MPDSEQRTLSDILGALMKGAPKEALASVDHGISADAYTRRRCEWYNASDGNMAGFNCTACRNRGYFMIPCGEYDTEMLECKCMKYRRYQQAMINAGLGDVYEKCTFEAYKREHEWQEQAFSRAMIYAQQSRPYWLYFAGNSGAGKTHLCTAVCSALAKKGYEVMYTTWSALLHRLEQARFDDTKTAIIMHEIRKVDVLYIDDFLKTPKNGKPSELALSYALEIINARYTLGNKRTILSSEYMIDEVTGFDEALGGRIRERAYLIQIKRGSDRNYRMRGTK